MESWDLDSIEHIEKFKLMLITRSDKVPGFASILKGEISCTLTDDRMILKYEVKVNAGDRILCHNHTSVNLWPSGSDKKIKSKIKESVNVMNVHLSDHLIVIPEGRYCSMADEVIVLQMKNNLRNIRFQIPK